MNAPEHELLVKMAQFWLGYAEEAEAIEALITKQGYSSKPKNDTARNTADALQYATTTIATLEAEKAKAEAAAFYASTDASTWQAKAMHEESRADRAEALLREAVVRFYADERMDGYDVHVTDYGLSAEVGPIIEDAGKTARAALGDSHD